MNIKRSKLFMYILGNAKVNIESREELDKVDRDALKLIAKLQNVCRDAPIQVTNKEAK